MTAALARNISLYRWSRLLRNLIFWHSVWFIYFQNTLSAAEALLLYVIYDLSTIVLELPSGYMSDRLGRRRTLIFSAAAGVLAMLILGTSTSFAMFAVGQILFGASMAFASGTEEAIFFESLQLAGREREVEDQEVIAWRYSFTGLALAGIGGGTLSLMDIRLPFLACALAHLILLVITLRFTEPHQPDDTQAARAGWDEIKKNVQEPVLIWFFCFALMTYTFSHLPFVFGQAFIDSRMTAIGLEVQAPFVSGTVSSIMMVVSLGTSLLLPALRARLGLMTTILTAFALQISLSGALAISDGVWVIGYLMLRMVPEGFYRPLALARIQPLLTPASRATWLSLQSFMARVVFAGVLLAASMSTSSTEIMTYPEIQAVLSIATLGGGVALILLAMAARRINIEDVKPTLR